MWIHSKQGRWFFIVSNIFARGWIVVFKTEKIWHGKGKKRGRKSFSFSLQFWTNRRFECSRRRISTFYWSSFAQSIQVHLIWVKENEVFVFCKVHWRKDYYVQDEDPGTTKTTTTTIFMWLNNDDDDPAATTNLNTIIKEFSTNNKASLSMLACISHEFNIKRIDSSRQMALFIINQQLQMSWIQLWLRGNKPNAMANSDEIPFLWLQCISIWMRFQLASRQSDGVSAIPTETRSVGSKNLHKDVDLWLENNSKVDIEKKESMMN